LEIVVQAPVDALAGMVGLGPEELLLALMFFVLQVKIGHPGEQQRKE
jgi:hypothetical protein